MSQFEGRKELGQAAVSAIDQSAAQIVEICKHIHANPEVAMEEHRAFEMLTGLLSASGFDLESGIGGLSTAFQAQARNWNAEDMRKGLRHGHVAFLAEYDADPEHGHNAGRHLVAGAALAAAFGLAATFEKMFGTVSVIGVPGGSGAKLADAGIFESPDCAIAAYPVSTGLGFQPTINQTSDRPAEQTITVHYPQGPDDALPSLQTAVAELVDDLEEPDVIEATSAGFVIRARRAATVEAVVDRVRSLVATRAESSGVPVEFETSPLIRDMQVSRILARRIKTFGDNIGLRQDRIHKTGPFEPSGWGNISHITPSVIAMYPISTSNIETGTAQFKRAGNSDEAYRQMLTIGKAMALAGLDVLGDIEFRGFVEGELMRGLRERGIVREPRRWLGVHPVQPRKETNNTRIQLPNTIARGPGLPAPRIEDFIVEDE